MGILNVTPDSFSDGGLYALQQAAVQHALDMVTEGADIIDIGGESTRPGAEPVSVAEELDRVVGVIEGLRAASAVPVSIDTSKPEVMRAAVAAGASMVNDVSALRATGALEAVAELGVPVCLMHMQGEPRTMQRAPEYDDIVDDVARFLEQRASACLEAGVEPRNIVVDPGFGFGKTLAHNLQLLRGLRRIADIGYPVLVGVSRKSMIGQILDRDVDQRLYGGLALALLARQNGTAVIRTHDVGPTVDVLNVMEAVTDDRESNG
jgi:dihydropteroate synthase